MKEDGHPETLPVPESASHLLYPLNAGVLGFQHRVGNASHDRVEYAPEIPSQHLANFLHSLQAATRDPAEQALPAFLRRSSVAVGPQLHRGLLDPPGSSRLEGQAREGHEVTARPIVQIRSVPL